MKKFILILLAALTALTVFAFGCSGMNAGKTASSQTSRIRTTVNDETPDENETPDEDDKNECPECPEKGHCHRHGARGMRNFFEIVIRVPEVGRIERLKGGDITEKPHKGRPVPIPAPEPTPNPDPEPVPEPEQPVQPSMGY